MKKLNTLPVLSIISILVFLLFAGLQCNDDENEPTPPPPDEDDCGEKVSSEFIYADLNNFALANYYHRNGDYAVYTFSVNTLENVCPHNHVKVTLEFNYTTSLRLELSIKSEVLYGIFFSYIIPYENWVLTESNNFTVDAKTIADFGIGPSFGSDPGWYKPFLELWITSSGNEDIDHQSIRDNVRNIKIRWEHYKYKEPES